MGSGTWGARRRTTMAARFDNLAPASARRSRAMASAASAARRTMGNRRGQSGVGDGEPPASGTRSATGSVAAVGDGTGAGDCDHSRTCAESGFEGDFGVADNFDVGASTFGIY